MAKAAAGATPIKLGARFRSEIEAAIASGVSGDSLVLNLTLMDASKLKRDPDVGLEDISFSESEMRYLGILVRQGGVRTSELASAEDNAAAEEARIAAEPPPTPKPKRASTSKAALAAAAAARS